MYTELLLETRAIISIKINITEGEGIYTAQEITLADLVDEYNDAYMLFSPPPSIN